MLNETTPEIQHRKRGPFSFLQTMFFHPIQDFVTLTRESQHFVVSAELTQYSTKVNEVAEKLQKDSRFIPNLHYPRVLMLQKARHH